MVVDDVEDDREAQRMRAVDEALERVVIAVHVIGREQLHAVVAPVPAARALRHRHDFEHRDAELAQVRELFDRGVERAGRRERADVHLVDHLAVQPRAAPLRVAPFEGAGIDDQRRAVHALRLKARAGIGPGPGAIDAILI